MRGSEATRVEFSGSDEVRYDTVSVKHILVADDNTYLRKLCVDVLVGAGYKVAGFANGAAAWQALQSNRYDLLVTDNKMPKMSGIEMIEKMRAACMLLPVIMATGYLPMQEFSRKPWLQPDATLERPFSNDDLLKTVKKVLRRNDDYNSHLKILLRAYP
ncbi:MAG: response regulator [Verrucomicrobiota bacterium]|jgi:CheY-like chemotaxis protein